MKNTVTVLALLLVVSLSSCGQRQELQRVDVQKPSDNITQTSESTSFSFEGTIFRYEKQDYDITTAIYSFWSDIYTYDGKIIKSYELPENQFIYDLAFIDNNTKLRVTILGDDGTEQIDIIDL